MTTYYVDPVLGSDSYNGSTWALARKSLNAAGWQFAGLAPGDTINVAKTTDPTPIGQVTFTKGAKTVDFLGITVQTIFDRWGGATTSINRNNFIGGAAATDFVATGAAAEGTYAISIRNATDYRYYPSLMGNIQFPGVSVSGAADYIAVRVSNRRPTTSLYLTTRETTTSDPRLFNTIETATAGDAAAGRATLMNTMREGYIASENYVNVGGALFSETNPAAGTETLYFPVAGRFSTTTIRGIGFYTHDTSPTSMTIEGVYVVRGLAAILPNTGSAIVVGARGGPMKMLQSLQVQDGASSGQASRLVGNMTFNWNDSATVTADGQIAPTVRVPTSVTLTGSGLTVRGGVNRSTGAQDGTTRLSNAFSATTSGMGTGNVEFSLTGGNLSGFSMHNFAQGLRLNLTSGIANQSYTFDDIQGNNFGYYIYSGDGTCPTNVQIRYKRFGPNNALFTDATMAACTGWSASLLSVSPLPIAMAWSSSTASTTSFAQKNINAVRFASASASTASFGALRRTRGFKFSSPATSSVSYAPRVARRAGYASSTTSTVTPRLGKLVVRGFSSGQTSTVTQAAHVARGVRANFGATSTAAVTLLRSTRLPSLPVSGASSVSGGFVRGRQVGMSVPVASSVAESASRLRPVGFASAASTTVAGRIDRAVRQGWSSYNQLEMTLDENKALAFASRVLSAVGVDLRRSRGVRFTAQAAVQQSWRLGASRPAGFQASAEASVDEFQLDRLRGMVFTVPMSSFVRSRLDSEDDKNMLVEVRPVVSFAMIRSSNRGIEVLAQSGAEMRVRMGRAVDYIVGQYATFDGTLLSDGQVSQEDFGSTSGTDFAFGIGRGVRAEVEAATAVTAKLTRHIVIGMGVAARAVVNSNASPNRLDAFYVEYDEPVTSSLRDGSIVLGARRTYASGILHDVSPTYEVTVHPAPTYTITLYEEELTT